MKIRFLFNDYRPLLKCGADPVSLGVGAAVAGGVNLAGSALQADQSSSNVNKQLRAQSEENQKNRDWQTEQAEIARQWEAGQVFQQNQFTREQAGQQQLYNLQSMKQQALYNSPVYQRQQLEAAGINPQVYFGYKSSFGGSSPVAGGAPGIPSPGSAPGVGSVQGLSPVGYQPANLQIPELMSSLGSMMSGLANAKKSGIETSFLEQSLESRIKEAVAKGDMAETAAALQELDLAFQKANFDTRLKHAYAQYKETLVNIDLLSEKKLTEQEEQKLKQATAAMNKAIQALNEEEKNKLGIVIQYLPRMLESEILANRGSAAAGFGSAANQRAQAAVNNVVAKIKSEEFKFTNETLRYQLDTLKNENYISSKQTEIVDAAAAQAEYEKDHQALLFWKNFICDVLQTGVGAFATYRNSAAFLNLSKSSKDEVTRKIQEMRFKYGDVYEFETNSSGFSRQKSTYHTPRD